MAGVLPFCCTPPLPLAGVSIATERERQHTDRTLAGGHQVAGMLRQATALLSAHGKVLTASLGSHYRCVAQTSSSGHQLLLATRSPPSHICAPGPRSNLDSEFYPQPGASPTRNSNSTHHPGLFCMSWCADSESPGGRAQPPPAPRAEGTALPAWPTPPSRRAAPPARRPSTPPSGPTAAAR